MVKLHLGCGKRNFGKDWYHIDSGNYQHLDYNVDVSKLPFNNNSVNIIYASHLIAYFDKQQIYEILKEWYRVLKPKGILRVATPDFNEICRLQLSKRFTLDNFVGPLFGKMKMGDKIIYHKFTYDFILLKKVLTDCNFNNIVKYNWRKTEHSQFDDSSQAYLPHMDKENGILISLNIEATK